MNKRSVLFAFKDSSKRTFPSSIVPLFQKESTKCETVHMKMNSAYRFIFMQIKLVLIRIVLHLASH